MEKGSIRREGWMLIPRLQAWVIGWVVGPPLRWTAKKKSSLEPGWGVQPGVC